ncbi:transporter [Marinithermofilum abyssi]|uniref:Transporter n=1 Tax=Marinithermofilum abyssi TaxID=1571185 RepID=A0A8J2YC20_9BACL|nr:alpha/beta hydrolase [Marinithermofilum abyssi]GGE03383.1 transporter [Marinithermofilum abyssi]
MHNQASPPWDMLWIPGWSVPPSVFRNVQQGFPARHHEVSFLHAARGEEILSTVVEAVENVKEPVHLVGWSMGGMAALAAAACLPERVASLCLIGAVPRFVRTPDSLWGWDLRVLERMKQQLRRDAAGVLTAFDKRMFSRQERGEETYRQWRENRELLPVESLEAGLNFLEHFLLPSHLRRCALPIHLLHGEQDGVCPVQGGKALADLLPRVTWTVWEGTGHLPFWTQPVRFQQWLKERMEVGIGQTESSPTI